MPTLHVAIDTNELRRFNILVERFKLRTQVELIHLLNGIGEDVLDGRLVHVQKRAPIKEIDKDAFSECIAREKAKDPAQSKCVNKAC